MPAPSVSWVDIPDGDLDPESPFTTSLATAYRNNAKHNYEWIGYGYTPAQAHNHDGVNSKLLPSVTMGNIFAFQGFT